MGWHVTTSVRWTDQRYDSNVAAAKLSNGNVVASNDATAASNGHAVAASNDATADSKGDDSNGNVSAANDAVAANDGVAANDAIAASNDAVAAANVVNAIPWCPSITKDNDVIAWLYSITTMIGFVKLIQAYI